MTKDPRFKQGNMILDACCVINLYATGRMAEIMDALPQAVFVSDYVKDREALAIYESTDDTALQERRKETIDIEPLMQSGSLSSIALDCDKEGELFVRLAERIDDGEAHTGAIAISRDWSVATDDGKAIKVLTQMSPRIQIVQTPDIIKFWAEHTRAGIELVRQTLLNIELRANYLPSKKHPLKKWWVETRM